MKEVADIITADSTGESEMGKYTGRRTSPPHDEIAQLAFSCMSRVADRTATTSKIGCVPNRNSGGTTRNCGVPRFAADQRTKSRKQEGPVGPPVNITKSACRPRCIHPAPG